MPLVDDLGLACCMILKYADTTVVAYLDLHIYLLVVMDERLRAVSIQSQLGYCGSFVPLSRLPMNGACSLMTTC